MLKEIEKKPTTVSVQRSPFRMTIGDGRTVEELIRNYGVGRVNRNISPENFPVSRSIELREREVVFIEGSDFSNDPSIKDVLKIAGNRGLERPKYEDALYFGDCYDGWNDGGTIVFLHKPLLIGNRLCILYFHNEDDGRYEFLEMSDYDKSVTWSRGCSFAFIRRASPRP